MKYQLVLQWPASTIADYDAMVAIEGLLIEGLSNDNQVDGHDVGSGEINIFIITNNPERAFSEVRRVLGERDIWSDARVAYREVAKTEYTPLWPSDLKDFSVA